MFGGTVAEWSKALLLREKISENQKMPGWAIIKKTSRVIFHLKIRKLPPE